MSLFVARIKGFVRFKDLMGQLVSRDLKLKYRRSVLGYLWSVLNPLFIMIIMAIVFSKMFTRASITNFPVYLMSGQVMFNFMNLSTKSAIQSINGSASLLKKTYVPKYGFTVSKIISGLSTFDCYVIYWGRIYVAAFSVPACARTELCIYDGAGTFFGGNQCIFPRYPVYLQCDYNGMALSDADVLSN